MKELEILNGIQTSLNAPKGQFNGFGKYKYRSCEDILEALKPLLKTSGACLIVTDEMVNLGDRFYVKAKAEIIINEKSFSTYGYARESLTKKGMDESQITGATSSYARKYALNGLFCIDDNKDADSINKHGNDDVKIIEKPVKVVDESKKATEQIERETLRNNIKHILETHPNISSGHIDYGTKTINTIGLFMEWSDNNPEKGSIETFKKILASSKELLAAQ